MLKQRKKNLMLVALIGYPILMYVLALYVPYFKNTLIDTLMSISSVNPGLIPKQINKNTFLAIVYGTLIYITVFSIIISSMQNTRIGEEYGSACFGSIRDINKKYKSKIYEENVRFTKNIYMGIDKKHIWMRNQNNLIIGGSGSMKTRGYVIPNILMANCSFLVTDPKGEILTKCGSFLKKKGYEVKVVDLKNMEKSHCYNPFKYFRSDDDVLSFVINMWESMSDKKASKGDEVWPEQAKAMLLSFMLFLYHYAPLEEQNFDTVMKLLHEVRSDEQNEGSILDILFEKIDKNDTAYGYYKAWSSATGRTRASIVATLSGKMTVFNMESLKKLTYTDEINFIDMANRKVALFCVIPDNDTKYNFLVSTLYSQCINILYDYADNVCKGPLPNMVRFIMDEFANVALPDNFEHNISTSRSRNIFFSIILQNKVQLKALYEKIYQAIEGSCDEFLFLGSSEIETCEAFSKLMGKETIIVKNKNKTYGLRGNTSVQETRTGRELVSADELRKFPNEKAILYVRGEDPVIDFKIILKKCKDYCELADGKYESKNLYEWGHSIEPDSSITFVDSNYQGTIIPLIPSKSVFISDEDLIKLFK